MKVFNQTKIGVRYRRLVGTTFMRGVTSRPAPCGRRKSYVTSLSRERSCASDVKYLNSVSRFWQLLAWTLAKGASGHCLTLRLAWFAGHRKLSRRRAELCFSSAHATHLNLCGNVHGHNQWLLLRSIELARNCTALGKVLAGDFPTWLVRVGRHASCIHG